MKPFLLVVALIVGVTNGTEETDPYKTNCPIGTVKMPAHYFDENCAHKSDSIDNGKIFTDTIRPTYEKILGSSDAVASDICSQEFLKHSGGKHPECKEDLKQLLCDDNYLVRVFNRHFCYYRKLLSTIFEDEDKWKNNAGDLCYILSNDVLCTTATTWTCERIDNRFTRGYCNKRLGDVVCKKIRDGAKKVVNPEPTSTWTKFKRYFG